MSDAHAYTAQVLWQRDPAERFTDHRYSRRHHLRFDGGVELVGSSSPAVVPLPYSDAAGVDPEEMFVAALAACHMLWFLSLAAKGGWVIEHYRDEARGVMTRNANGQLWMSQVTLRPEVAFASDRQPSPVEIDGLHHAAHEQCFIANSVRTHVRVLSGRA